MTTHYDPHGHGYYSCGGDDDCVSVERAPNCVSGLAHQWTRRGCGGCDSNPGVWSLGGTTYAFEARCRLCGTARKETNYGWQRNPGQCDELRYVAGEYEPEPAAVRHALALRRRRDRDRTRRAERVLARVPLDFGAIPLRDDGYYRVLREITGCSLATAIEAMRIADGRGYWWSR